VPSIKTQQGQGTFFTSINQPAYKMMMFHFRTAFCLWTKSQRQRA